jgi:hypothetical protein
MPGAMAAVARPGILARIGHHRGPRRVGLDVPQNDEQVVAVLDDRGSEAALPTVDDLLPYRAARPPTSQTETVNRRKITRKARSKKNRAVLLAELEHRYPESPAF